MKVKIPLQPKASAAMKKTIVAESEKYLRDFEAMTLWVLHSQFGFGKIRLERFYEKFVEGYDEFVKRYEMEDCYPQMQMLKQIGVDVDELYRKYKSFSVCDN